MARLIDADKLELKETVRIQLCGLKEYVALYSYTKEQIKEAPTVKAIPMGWISEYSRKPLSNADYWAIMRMVTAWEKENEKS